MNKPYAYLCACLSAYAVFNPHWTMEVMKEEHLIHMTDHNQHKKILFHD